MQRPGRQRDALRCASRLTAYARYTALTHFPGDLPVVKGSSARKPDHSVDPLFVDRWSPRAMSGEPIPEADLFTLFEAARWAPSGFNLQVAEYTCAGDALRMKFGGFDLQMGRK